MKTIKSRLFRKRNFKLLYYCTFYKLKRKYFKKMLMNNFWIRIKVDYVKS